MVWDEWLVQVKMFNIKLWEHINGDDICKHINGDDICNVCLINFGDYLCSVYLIDFMVDAINFIIVDEYCMKNKGKWWVDVKNN